MQKKSKLEELFKSKAGIMLDIGGGGTPQKGYVNMDMRKLPTVDIVHDIEDSRGFPLPDDCVTRVLCSHILEHICPKKIMFVMSEIHRICKQHAQVLISVPYGGSVGSIQDPTHCAFFNEFTFEYFDDTKPLWRIYQPPPMRIQMRTFDLSGNVEVVLVVMKGEKNGKQTKSA